MPKLKISISPKGEVTIDAVGYTGSACHKATAAIEQALGISKASEPKPELYQEQQLSDTDNLSLGGS